MMQFFPDQHLDYMKIFCIFCFCWLVKDQMSLITVQWHKLLTIKQLCSYHLVICSIGKTFSHRRFDQWRGNPMKTKASFEQCYFSDEPLKDSFAFFPFFIPPHGI